MMTTNVGWHAFLTHSVLLLCETQPKWDDYRSTFSKGLWMPDTCVLRAV